MAVGSQGSQLAAVRSVSYQLLMLQICSHPLTAAPHGGSTLNISLAAGYRIHSTDTNGPLSGDYLKGYEDSVFCLASTGAGWGVRLKLSAMFGCIPVIIADKIQVMPIPGPCLACLLLCHDRCQVR